MSSSKAVSYNEKRKAVRVLLIEIFEGRGILVYDPFQRNRQVILFLDPRIGCLKPYKIK